MSAVLLTAGDIAQIEDRGLTLEEVRRQIAIFEAPPPYVRLERPCVAGDGIRVPDASEMRACREAYDGACAEGRVLKFTPASGAATRMFEALLAACAGGAEVMRQEQSRRAQAGERGAREVVAFMEGIRRFAFFDDLKATMEAGGLDAEALVDAGRFGAVIEYLLTSRGLGYASLPKGLILFHRYPEGGRTAFEEHLADAALYARDRNGACRLHFTVSAPHRGLFEALLERVRPEYERRRAARFDVGFSAQSARSDTIAVGLDNRPFRDAQGRLLFRPGGHGALIENLSTLGGDLVVIKNIDNVVPDCRKEPIVAWTKVLGGYLVRVQRRIAELIRALSAAAPGAAAVSDAMSFLRQELLLSPPGGLAAGAAREFALGKLNRPVRVCGMVRTEVNPGGGPFWVKGKDGILAPQIVETAQVDALDAGQQSVMAASTHFNPVDIVCGVRDWTGRPFDLLRFVDPDAVFITRKSSNGRGLKALEHPGLWNGGMADWNTIFVEVPAATFNPVKAVSDLLQPEHSPP